MPLLVADGRYCALTFIAPISQSTFTAEAKCYVVIRLSSDEVIAITVKARVESRAGRRATKARTFWRSS